MPCVSSLHKVRWWYYADIVEKIALWTTGIVIMAYWGILGATVIITLHWDRNMGWKSPLPPLSLSPTIAGVQNESLLPWWPEGGAWVHDGVPQSRILTFVGIWDYHSVPVWVSLAFWSIWRLNRWSAEDSVWTLIAAIQAAMRERNGPNPVICSPVTATFPRYRRPTQCQESSLTIDPRDSSLFFPPYPHRLSWPNPNLYKKSAMRKDLEGLFSQQFFGMDVFPVFNAF